MLQGEILKEKATRIEKQKNAVEKYEQFLKQVMNKSGGEYSAIEEIVKRFETLNATHKELSEIQFKKEAQLTQMKNDAGFNEKTQNNEIMKLNNQIAKLNT